MPKNGVSHTLILVAVSLAASALLAASAIAIYRACRHSAIYIAAPAESPSIEPPRNGTPRTDTSAQRILLIGDSMAYTLMFRAQNYCNHNGHTLNVVTWVSATSKTFASCDTMEYFVNLYRPTYIIFVIGANEMFKKDAMSRSQYFDRIIPQTCGVPMVVVGPPNWREDTGINNLMMSIFGPRQFFLSKKLKYTRVDGDVVHPNRASGTMWMDSVASWITHQSCFPIKMEPPVEPNPIHVDFEKLVLTDPSLS